MMSSGKNGTGVIDCMNPVIKVGREKVVCYSLELHSLSKNILIMIGNHLGYW